MMCKVSVCLPGIVEGTPVGHGMGKFGDRTALRLTITRGCVNTESSTMLRVWTVGAGSARPAKQWLAPSRLYPQIAACALGARFCPCQSQGVQPSSLRYDPIMLPRRDRLRHICNL